MVTAVVVVTGMLETPDPAVNPDAPSAALRVGLRSPRQP
jgi:hypothetical protein